jgi:hypothetical protein
MAEPKNAWTDRFSNKAKAWGYAAFSGWLLGVSQIFMGAVMKDALGIFLIVAGALEVAMAFVARGRALDDPLPGSKAPLSKMPWTRRSGRIISCGAMLALAAIQVNRVDPAQDGAAFAASCAALILLTLAGYCATMSPKATAGSTAPKDKP